MKQVALVGMRGLVGSVLMNRMIEENDFAHFEPHFFSSSQAGQKTNLKGFEQKQYIDANNIDQLAQYDIILTCQGGSYTEKTHPQLRAKGWNGFWIDAASTLRMNDDAMIIFDPLNGKALNAGINKGIKNFVGANCTVSLLLFALDGLIKQDLIEWLSIMTYQAASGAGAEAMRELLLQMHAMTAPLDFNNPAISTLELERTASKIQTSTTLPMQATLEPLAGSLLPWIDSDLGNGISREEKKAPQEAHKILGKTNILLDSLCIRVGTLRCHSQAITMKLKRNINADEITEILNTVNPWVKVIPNTKEQSLKHLTPAAIAGTLNVAIGRLRKLNLPGEMWSAFTVGDQLLWGAAEPLRRFLKILLEQDKIKVESHK